MRFTNVVLCGSVLAVSVLVLGGCVTVGQQRAEAVSAYQVGDYDRAEVLFEAVLERRPIDAESHYYLGAMAHSKRNYIRALHCYEQSIRKDPSYLPARNGIEQVKVDLGPDRYRRLQTNPELYEMP